MMGTANDIEMQVMSICSKNGLVVTEQSFRLLQNYVELLSNWNAKVNLVSRSDIKNIWWNHILHSLAVLCFLKIESGTKILDLGTGGGLPGIPISIVRDDLEITVLDSIRKKTTAVQNIVDNLSVTNVKVLTGRAEKIAQQHRSCWDVTIARAVAPLNELIKWSKPLLKNSGRKKIEDFQQKTWETPLLVALKGGDLAAEVQAAKTRSATSDIQIIDMVFAESETIGMNDKKIVVVKW